MEKEDDFQCCYIGLVRQIENEGWDVFRRKMDIFNYFVAEIVVSDRR